jgi:hypothetical protein
MGMHADDPDENEDYFRVRAHATGWVFEVGIVEWGAPNQPEVRWRAFRDWKRLPDTARVARARAAALGTPRFFRRCKMCVRVTNVGHMFSVDLCQGCAQEQHGVVY